MSEKRRSKRIPVTMRLSISDLYKENQPSSGIHNLDSPIKIVEISRVGIAFTTGCVLPTGYCFNASFDFEDKTPSMFTVVRIVRSEALDCDSYMYGCEFTNLPQNLAGIIDQYAEENDEF